MNTIDEIILKHSENEYKIPIFTYDEWQELKERFKQDDESKDGISVILPAIQRYLNEHKPPIPISRPDVSAMEHAFFAMQDSDYTRNINKDFNPNTVRNKFNEKVEVEYILSAGFNYNSVSNHFHCDNRYTCGYHTKRSNYEIWNDPMSKDFSSQAQYLWREFKNERSPIDQHKYRAMFRLSGYVATQFKPTVAQTIYEERGAKTVIDISCGWGDRLAGFYVSKNTQEYLGCDPNIQSYELYKKQCIEYERLLQSPLFPTEVVFEDHGDWFEVRGNKRVRIYNKPAEDVDWDNVVEQEHDLMFTSPPYFGIERYAEGQEGEENQSWSRYSEYDGWRDFFLYPVMDAMVKHCKVVMVNIVDPVVKGKRYPVEEDLRSRYGIGSMIGMKMAKRPNGKKDQKQFEVDGEKLNFIEPIYILGDLWKPKK